MRSWSVEQKKYHVSTIVHSLCVQNECMFWDENITSFEQQKKIFDSFNCKFDIEMNVIGGMIGVNYFLPSDTTFDSLKIGNVEKYYFELEIGNILEFEHKIKSTHAKRYDWLCKLSRIIWKIINCQYQRNNRRMKTTLVDLKNIPRN